MRLNLTIFDAVEGWVCTHGYSRRMLFTRFIGQPSGIHTINRDKAARLQLQICCREPQFTPTRQAVHDFPVHQVRTTKQPSRTFHVPRVQIFADAG